MKKETNMPCRGFLLGRLVDFLQKLSCILFTFEIEIIKIVLHSIKSLSIQMLIK